MLKRIEIPDNVWSMPGYIEIGGPGENFINLTLAATKTNERVWKSIGEEQAKQLRDALIEIYPLDGDKKEPKYRIRTHSFADYEVVFDQSFTETSVFARAFTVEDAQRIADSLNAAEAH